MKPVLTENQKQKNQKEERRKRKRKTMRKVEQLAEFAATMINETFPDKAWCWSDILDALRDSPDFTPGGVDVTVSAELFTEDGRPWHLFAVVSYSQNGAIIDLADVSLVGLGRGGQRLELDPVMWSASWLTPAEEKAAIKWN